MNLRAELLFAAQHPSSPRSYASVVTRGLFLHDPLPDYGVPPLAAPIVGFVLHLRGLLEAGHCLFVHCRGGLGRTGMVAVLLVAAMFDADNPTATRFVNDATEMGRASIRGEVRMPETDEQRKITRDGNEGVRLAKKKR